MSRRPAADANKPRQLNPHAVRMTADELEQAVNSFYGTKTIIVDKALAQCLLEFNKANRTINARKIDRLVAQMQSGVFENTGEPVIISAEGILNDGQHRLTALVQADAVIDLDIRFGIPRKVFTKTDTGTSRTGSDILAIRGVAGGASIAPAVRLLVLYRRGLPDSIREYVSNAEIDDGFRKWQGIESVVRQMSGHRFPKGVKSTPLLATAYLASRSPGKERLAAWLETLATGLATGKTDPAYHLREHLMRGVEAPIGTRESLVERFALMILSWNAYGAEGKVSARDLRWSPTGKAAAPFPQVEGIRL